MIRADRKEKEKKRQRFSVCLSMLSQQCVHVHIKIDCIENKRVTRFGSIYSWLFHIYIYIFMVDIVHKRLRHRHTMDEQHNILNRQRFWSILVGYSMLCTAWMWMIRSMMVLLLVLLLLMLLRSLFIIMLPFHCFAAWWCVPYVHITRSRLNVGCSSENIKLKKVTGSFHETLRTFWH